MIDESFETIHSYYGDLTIPGRVDLISRALKKYGEWACLEAEFCGGIIKRKSTIYDLGGYIGTFSLGILSGFSTKVERIVSVEANKFSFDLLAANLKKYPQAVVENAIVSLSDHSYAPELDESNLGATKWKIDKSSVSGAIKGTPLWKLRKEYGDYDFLKADVEGMEEEVIVSDQKWIKENKPVLYLECNNDEKSLDLFELLLWLDYKVYYFSFPAFNKKNFKKVTEDIFNGAHEAALVAVNQPVSLTRNLKRLGCVLKVVESKEQLKKALWYTPRWVSGEVMELSRSELEAVVQKYLLGNTVGDFLKVDETAGESKKNIPQPLEGSLNPGVKNILAGWSLDRVCTDADMAGQVLLKGWMLGRSKKALNVAVRFSGITKSYPLNEERSDVIGNFKEDHTAHLVLKCGFHYAVPVGVSIEIGVEYEANLYWLHTLDT